MIIKINESLEKIDNRFQSPIDHPELNKLLKEAIEKGILPINPSAQNMQFYFFETILRQQKELFKLLESIKKITDNLKNYL